MNIGIIEIIVLTALAFAAFSKNMPKDTRNMLMIGLGVLFLIIFLQGGGGTPGTPLSVVMGGMNLTNLLVVATVAFYLIHNKDENPSQMKSYKPIMIGLMIYFFFSAASSPSTF